MGQNLIHDNVLDRNSESYAQEPKMPDQYSADNYKFEIVERIILQLVVCLARIKAAFGLVQSLLKPLLLVEHFLQLCMKSILSVKEKMYLLTLPKCIV